MEFASVVNVNGTSKTCRRPGMIDLAPPQPRFLLEYRLCDANPSPESGGVVQDQIEACHKPSVDVDCEGENAPDGLPRDLVNDD